MKIEIKVPATGESISEVTLSKWLVSDGDYVEMDQPVCEFESDKATLEFPAEKSGKIAFRVEEGADLKPGDVIAEIDTDAVAPQKQKVSVSKSEVKREDEKPEEEEIPAEKETPEVHKQATPLAEKIAKENGVKLLGLKGSGSGGRITKEDVLLALQQGLSAKEILHSAKKGSREEHGEKLSKLRRTIAKRLVGVKNQTAMLTTFNEADMSAVMKLRSTYKEAFEKKHGVSLGYMSFFVRACCNALQEFPGINAYWDDENILYHDFQDISIAISTDRGLVVPVLRNAESMGMAEIEKQIKSLAEKARSGTLTLEEMEGGTFTITNGGVFGSLMSTPIINAPQSAILGMHKIQERPVAVEGMVQIRPMMYLALSYDHRIVDGKDSVRFLVRVKEQLEDPASMLFGADALRLLLDL